MQKRDTLILTIAVVCGLSAFVMTANLLGDSAQASPKTAPAMAPASAPEDPSLIVIPIPNGMRAMTISAKEMSDLPDMLKKGSVVDVLGPAPGDQGTMELQTLARGIQVISLEKKDNKIETVTLSLHPYAIETVSRATAGGKLRLIVRPDNDSSFIGGVEFIEIIRGVDAERKMRLEKEKDKEARR